jgi:uncharacterized cupredoxin-like copper-binding protein
MRYSTDEEINAAGEESLELLSTPEGVAELEFDAAALAAVAQTGSKTEAQAIATLLTAAVQIGKESTANAEVLIAVGGAAIESVSNSYEEAQAEFEMEQAVKEFAETGDFSAVLRALGFADGGVVGA